MSFSPEIWELLRKIIFCLCRKYGFDDLTTDYNENHGKNGRFASSNASGTSSAKQEGKQQPAQNSVKTSLRPKGAQTPDGEKMLALFRAKSVKLNLSKQAQHRTAQEAREATAKEQAKHPGVDIMPKSYFTKKFQSVEASTLDRIRKGDFEEIAGSFNSPRFHVVFDDAVGKVYNKDTGKFEASHTVEAVYSKSDGYHMWPVSDDRKGR